MKSRILAVVLSLSAAAAGAQITKEERDELIKVGTPICSYRDQTEAMFVERWDAAPEAVKTVAKTLAAGELVMCAVEGKSAWRIRQLARVGILNAESGRASLRKADLRILCDLEAASAFSVLFPASREDLRSRIEKYEWPMYRHSTYQMEAWAVPQCQAAKASFLSQAPEKAVDAIADPELKATVQQLAPRN
ncbi:MAG: hypothetical protein HY078_01845 [Elusimicrobia bacterium]|nr:hypothetical protein [Elusimicrobiota bacterium]